MITIATPVLDGKKTEQESENNPESSIEKIAILEAEHSKDKELLSLLIQPVITKADLVKHGAIIDTWNGKATLNNLQFKREFMQDSYRLVF